MSFTRCFPEIITHGVLIQRSSKWPV
jgi:hypothetical protein